MPPLLTAAELLSEPVKLRLRTIRDVLSSLEQAKKVQDSSPKNPGKGVWISFPLWRALMRQLNSQIAEVHEWEKLLLSTQQEAGSTRQQLLSFEQTMLAQQRANEKKCAGLEDLLAQQQASMFEQQRSWNRQRDDLTQQTDRALKMLKDREQVAVENEHLVNALREAQVAAAQADVRAQEAEMRAAAMQQQSNYFVDKTSDGQAHRTALAHQVRDLGLALSQARAQVEQYRQQQVAKQRPAQELLEDVQRLRVDNERLVGLLSSTKPWKRIAKDLSTEGGSHYIPVEEALVHKGNVSSTYTPLKDRTVELAALGTDPEEWHWVPQQAVSVALEAVANVLPTTPLKPLFHVLLSLNKVWRQREEKKVAAMKQQHASELRELHRLYRQRAPYEAVVGNTRLSDLKKQLRLQAAHARQLAAKGEGRVHKARDDGQMFLALGLDSVNALNQQVTRLQGKNTRLCRKLAAARKQPLLCPACTSLSVDQIPPLMLTERERSFPSRPPPTEKPSVATQQPSLGGARAAAPHLPPSYPPPSFHGQPPAHVAAAEPQPPAYAAAAPHSPPSYPPPSLHGQPPAHPAAAHHSPPSYPPTLLHWQPPPHAAAAPSSRSHTPQIHQAPSQPPQHTAAAPQPPSAAAPPPPATRAHPPPHTAAAPSQPPSAAAPTAAPATLPAAAKTTTSAPPATRAHPPPNTTAAPSQPPLAAAPTAAPATLPAAAAVGGKPVAPGGLSESAAGDQTGRLALGKAAWDSYLPARFFPSTYIPPAERAQGASSKGTLTGRVGGPQTGFGSAFYPADLVGMWPAGHGGADHSGAGHTGAGLDGADQSGTPQEAAGHAARTQPHTASHSTTQQRPYSPSGLSSLAEHHFAPDPAASTTAAATTAMTLPAGTGRGGGAVGSVSGVQGSRATFSCGGGGGGSSGGNGGGAREGMNGSQGFISGDGSVGSQPHPSSAVGENSSKKADHLARLIHKYEQPVLRFSLWDREGRLQPS